MVELEHAIFGQYVRAFVLVVLVLVVLFTVRFVVPWLFRRRRG